jgi:hypothetical protein
LFCIAIRKETILIISSFSVMTRILFSKSAGSTSCVSRPGRSIFFWTALTLPIFLVAILFFSFQSPVNWINQQAEIGAAQAWYEAQHANTYFGEKPIQPNWSGAQAVQPKSDRLMIDVPLTNGSQFKHVLADPETGQANNAYRNGTTRLVLIKFGEGHYVPFLFHVFGNQPYITQHGLPASEANKPQSIQANFSGCMLYTHLNGDFFYGLYLENGAIQKILMPQDGLVERDPDPDWWIYLNEVVITAHAFDLGGLGYGSITIIISGGGGDWWGNGPIDEDINNGGGFTPPICPDGSLMGPGGECPPVEPSLTLNCTKVKDPLVSRPYDVTYTGLCAPGDGCNLTGHVQFSQDSPWYETMGVFISNSSATGVIPAGGGSTTVTFAWTVTYLEGIPLFDGFPKSVVESHEFYFGPECCKD